MLFEGSEKKLEVSFNDKAGSLFDWSRSKVDQLVARSEAQILSEVTNDECRAYLLSESSLFMWKDRLTMITCGQTNLANSAEFLIKEFGVEAMDSFIFERKNEYFPRHQKSDFYEDVKRFQKNIAGSAYRFGEPNEHHIFLFHMEKNYCPHNTDHTLEILMYGLQGKAKELFSATHETSAAIRDRILSEPVLQGYQFDDFVFQPQGYSCNAIKGAQYFTIHVTPQEACPYVSFETNAISCDYEVILSAVIRVFQPQSFDVMTFGMDGECTYAPKNYRAKSTVHEALDCGYDVSYSSFYLPNEKIERASILNI